MLAEENWWKSFRLTILKAGTFCQGKIVFMAPTKPLVAQQIQACYKIMGIPQVNEATAKLLKTEPCDMRLAPITLHRTTWWR